MASEAGETNRSATPAGESSVPDCCRSIRSIRAEIWSFDFGDSTAPARRSSYRVRPNALVIEFFWSRLCLTATPLTCVIFQGGAVVAVPSLATLSTV